MSQKLLVLGYPGIGIRTVIEKMVQQGINARHMDIWGRFLDSERWWVDPDLVKFWRDHIGIEVMMGFAANFKDIIDIGWDKILIMDTNKAYYKMVCYAYWDQGADLPGERPQNREEYGAKASALIAKKNLWVQKVKKYLETRKPGTVNYSFPRKWDNMAMPVMELFNEVQKWRSEINGKEVEEIHISKE
jgi:hypothetical protein